MKTWSRTPIARFCGNCHVRIERGEVLCLWTIVGVKSQKVRCPACAGESAPDVPPLADHPRLEPNDLVELGQWGLEK